MKDVFDEHYRNLTDKTCEGCAYLTVNGPQNGARGTSLNVWANQHKAVCNQYNIAWTCGNGTQIRRCFECIILGGK